MFEAWLFEARQNWYSSRYEIHANKSTKVSLLYNKAVEHEATHLSDWLSQHYCAYMTWIHSKLINTTKTCTPILQWIGRQALLHVYYEISISWSFKLPEYRKSRFKPYGNIYFTSSNSYLFMYISLTYLLNKLSSHILYASCKGMLTCLRRYIVQYFPTYTVNFFNVHLHGYWCFHILVKTSNRTLSIHDYNGV